MFDQASFTAEHSIGASQNTLTSSTTFPSLWSNGSENDVVDIKHDSPVRNMNAVNLGTTNQSVEELLNPEKNPSLYGIKVFDKFMSEHQVKDSFLTFVVVPSLG
jgi:hypothetical protein